MLTTAVWQSATVTAALLLLGLLRMMVTVRRASKRSRTRIAACTRRWQPWTTPTEPSARHPRAGP